VRSQIVDSHGHNAYQNQCSVQNFRSRSCKGTAVGSVSRPVATKPPSGLSWRTSARIVQLGKGACRKPTLCSRKSHTITITSLRPGAHKQHKGPRKTTAGIIKAKKLSTLRLAELRRDADLIITKGAQNMAVERSKDMRTPQQIAAVIPWVRYMTKKI
jgi:hypothetical protein